MFSSVAVKFLWTTLVKSYVKVKLVRKTYGLWSLDTTCGVINQILLIMIDQIPMIMINQTCLCFEWLCVEWCKTARKKWEKGEKEAERKEEPVIPPEV